MPDYKHRRRSRSPQEERTDRDERRRHDRSPHGYDQAVRNSSKTQTLPFQQTSLSKHDLRRYEALFAEYLYLQKGLSLNKLSETETKGRWKSFLNKWNHGELSQGWYDPAFFERVRQRSELRPGSSPPRQTDRVGRNDDLEDDELGPRMPGPAPHDYKPAIPNFQDLQHRRELDEEDRAEQKSMYQQERKLQRKADKDRLEELAPRADPGSRERQLEKKRDVTQSNKAFAEARDSGAVEIADNDLMGDDGIDAYKAKIKSQERKKNEREIRREEVLRARAAEREERLAEHRLKEEKTMQTLKALAQQRYGA